MIKNFKPDLLPKIRKLDIKANREFLAQTLSGNWLSSFKGRGIEFSDYRQYTSGDDASMIDWRASLRARKILVKELTEEKNLNVFILLDVSNSMLYGSQKQLKAEVAAELASNIAYVAARSGDAVSLVMMNEKIAHFLEPNMGVHQHSIITSLVADANKWGGGKDFAKSLAQLMGITKQKGLLVVISDFIGFGDAWGKYLEIASGRFEMIGICVRDPRDRRLPHNAGEYLLEDPFTDETIVIDCKTYYRPYANFVKKEEDKIRDYFRMVRGDAVIIETGQDYRKSLSKFFHKRAILQGDR